MKFVPTSIAGVYIVQPQQFTDERGYFARTYCEKEFAEIGVRDRFVQLNQSFNKIRGTFRGMHYQRPPFAEKKLVRCAAGAISDYVVDIRKGSPTFLQHLQVELSADNMDMILIPEGVAHGFVTLADNTVLLYHHTEFHNPSSEAGIRVDDPRLDLTVTEPITVMSARDKSYPILDPLFRGIEV